jgi:hypothetical protein
MGLAMIVYISKSQMKISGIQRCSNGYGESKPMSRQTILCTQMLASKHLCWFVFI